MAGPHPASRGFATRFGWARSVLNLVLLAPLLGACAPAPVGPVPINTAAPSNVCALAAVGGVLAFDTTYGLGFKSGESVRVVVWPYGYSARRESDGVVVLIDPSGRVVAREGDHLAAAGAFGDTATFVMCDLEVNPSPDPFAS
jgi:hypothetical protein